MTVDLRSDTVTLPTKKMLSAMASAVVGDDGRMTPEGRSEDPTVGRLEDKAAEILGMPAALFVPTGTFGNMMGVLSLSDGSSPMWVYKDAHILTSEKSLVDPALFGRQYESYNRLKEIPDVPPHDDSILLIENTVSNDAGRPLEPDELRRIHDLHQAGWRIHMDGARIFNAAIATETLPTEIVACCDTVTFCLSKGLGAPIGSLLCGDTTTINYARGLRKRLGGAMRQTGYVAAAGLEALEDTNIERLVEDHEKAAILKDAIGETQGVTVLSETNIVQIHFKNPIAPEVTELLTQHGFYVRDLSSTEIRALTHRDVSFEEAHQAGITIAECIDTATKKILKGN